MSYCINPECPSRQNADDAMVCQTCGTDLVLQGRERIARPLVPHDPRRPSALYETMDGQKVLKVLKWQEEKYVELFEREALTLQDLEHPRILKGYGLFKFITAQNEELLCFFMDKVPGQNLAQWIQENKRPSERFVLRCLRQILDILGYLHGEGFLHRDIKPDNVMITPDRDFFLIDFGSVQDIYKARTRIISDGYTAPEQVNQRSTPKSDLYALGRTVLHLATGFHPTLLERDKKSNKLFWYKKTRRFSRASRIFIDKLLAEYPSDRPNSAFIALNEITPSKLIWKWANSPIGLSFTTLTIIFGLAAMILQNAFLNDEYIKKVYSEAQSELVKSDYDKAKESLRSIIFINQLRFREESKHYNDLGIVYYKERDFVRAEENFRKSIDIKSDLISVAISHYHMARIYEETGDFEDAALEYSKAFVMIEKDSIYYFVIVNRYARLLILYEKDFNEALKISKDAFFALKNSEFSDSNIDIALINKNIGWALLEKRDIESAISYLLTATEARPDDATAYCLLAQTINVEGFQFQDLTWWKECASQENVDGLPETQIWQQQANRYLSR
ncbi:MAG: serine/threonine protein kinase [Spirulina sp. SIO3F2]|nr:serine/threonine protein kinase [Spirulina sp. SIO3F2]